MNLKSAALSVLRVRTLKHFLDELEIDGVDRRSTTAMRAVLSRSRRISADDLLSGMRKDEVKEVCRLVGVSTQGRLDALLDRLGVGLESAVEEAKKSGLEDGTRIKARGKGWVVVDRYGLFLVDPKEAIWTVHAHHKEIPPAVYPTAEAAYRAWQESNDAARRRTAEAAQSCTCQTDHASGR